MARPSVEYVAGISVPDAFGQCYQDPEPHGAVPFDHFQKVGTPDDGTDPNNYSNIEVFVDLQPQELWEKKYASKQEMVNAINADLTREMPGLLYNFSQYIKDNMDEAIAGVKGELGASGAHLDPEAVDISYNGVTVCRDGVACAHDEAAVTRALAGVDVELLCDLRVEHGEATVVPLRRRPRSAVAAACSSAFTANRCLAPFPSPTGP